MKHRNTRRYAVKASNETYASIVSSHCTLPEAYRAYVKLHKEQYKFNRFILAQTPRAIIATEVQTKTIQEDIQDWANRDLGPQSKQRVPMPIVVHQWHPKYKTYTRHGEKS